MELVNRSAIPINIRIIVEHALKRIESNNVQMSVTNITF